MPRYFAGLLLLTSAFMRGILAIANLGVFWSEYDITQN